MSYIKHVLQPGETVRYQGSTHWMLYFPAILLTAAGIVILILTRGAPQPYGVLLTIACFLVAVILAVRAWWLRWNTEIAVTDRRVIYVHGFFDRQSVEVHMNQVESVDVDQTLLGRLFGYGDVTIHGTGNTYDPLRAVDRPIALRNEIIAR
jgi:uncharacterized membrane protein YdbT with pleckstrin-like domain